MQAADLQANNSQRRIKLNEIHCLESVSCSKAAQVQLVSDKGNLELIRLIQLPLVLVCIDEYSPS